MPPFSLHFVFTAQHGTSCCGENGLESTPSGDNGEALQSGSQEDDDNDDDSAEDADEEEDAELTKQLNKQRKKAIAAAHGGRRRLVSSRNTYKDKGKGTMNSKIQRQACKW
jgi:RIO kinase 2